METEEFEAATTAAEALWDGLTSEEVRQHLEDAHTECGATDRWELLAEMDRALGGSLRRAVDGEYK